ncbi:hypothetical protein ACTMU2_38765 [Cupriavidus basilensis]
MPTGTYEGGTLFQGLRLRDVVFASGAATRVTVRPDRQQLEHGVVGAALACGVAAHRQGGHAARTVRARYDASEDAELARIAAGDRRRRAVTLERLTLRTSPAPTAQPMVFSGLAGALHSDGQRHRVVVDRLETPYGKLAANAQIAAKAAVRAERAGSPCSRRAGRRKPLPSAPMRKGRSRHCARNWRPTASASAGAPAPM